MNTPNNKMSQSDIELLSLLISDIGAVNKVCGDIYCEGYRGTNKSTVAHREALETQLAGLLASLQILHSSGAINNPMEADPNNELIKSRFKRLNHSEHLSGLFF